MFPDGQRPQLKKRKKVKNSAMGSAAAAMVTALSTDTSFQTVGESDTSNAVEGQDSNDLSLMDASMTESVGTPSTFVSPAILSAVSATTVKRKAEDDELDDVTNKQPRLLHYYHSPAGVQLQLKTSGRDQ